MATTHSRLVGGSNAGITLACPGSIEERRKSPNTHNIYAAKGTCFHTIAEDVMKNYKGMLSADEMVKRYAGRIWADFLDKPEEIEAYGQNKLTVADIEQKAIPAVNCVLEILTFDDSLDIDFEHKMKFDRAPYSPYGEDFEITDDKGNDSGGTADMLFSVWAADPATKEEDCQRAGVIDYKFGENVIDPADNDQMKFYLAAGIHNGVLPQVDEYEAWIIQPAGRLAEEDYARKAVYTWEELEDFVHDLRDAVDTLPHQYVTGDHCKNCNGKVTCKAFAALRDMTQETDIEGMDSKRLAEALRQAELMEAWVKDVRAAALRNAGDGVSIPGYVYDDEGLGNRTYKDETAAERALGRLGLKKPERTVTKPISAPKALELLKKKGVDEKIRNNFENRHITRPPAPPKLRKLKDGETDATGLEMLAEAMSAAA